MSNSIPAPANGGSLGNPKWDTWFFGHPRGLSTLFFTEMWERFSYYGMRALLILFMVASRESGGMGLDVATAGAIYGIYTASVYLLSLPGGWIADNLIGQRKAVVLGGILIALGHFVLFLPTQDLFYWGLLIIAPGVGLLKPNISAMVGQLYRKGDNRRDAGFSLYYIGINVGALLAPIACGYVGQMIDWHWGFLIAGVGMTLGLIQFWLGTSYLGQAGINPGGAVTPEEKERAQRTARTGGLITAAVVAVLVALPLTGMLTLNAQQLADSFGVVLLITTLAFFAWLFGAGNWTRDERNKLIVVTIFFVAVIFFWSAFEQAGSTLNLFAERNTRNEAFGMAFPASWFQSVNALFIIALAPVFAWLWVRLGPKEPSSPTKFAVGLFLVGAGFALMLIPANMTGDGTLVSPWWLVVMYFFHTTGELCISPVGLSAMTKLAPERVSGLIMGVWFLGPAIANYVSGRLGGLYESMPLPQLFGLVTAFSIGSAVVMALVAPWAKRLMGEVK